MDKCPGVIWSTPHKFWWHSMTSSKASAAKNCSNILEANATSPVGNALFILPNLIIISFKYHSTQILGNGKVFYFERKKEAQFDFHLGCSFGNWFSPMIFVQTGANLISSIYTNIHLHNRLKLISVLPKATSIGLVIGLGLDYFF